MTADQHWDDWTAEHLLADRPQKWQRSLLAMSDGQEVGWAAVSLREGCVHLHHLVVAPSWRGHGVGSMILGHVLEQAGENGFVTLKVHNGNTRAQAFYFSHGFTAQPDSTAEYSSLRRAGQTRRSLRVAVHQPNYLPWGGYFAKLMSSDRFVFLDDAQMPQGRSFVSRTKIGRGFEGDQWLTLPVTRHGRPPINGTSIADDKWWPRHKKTLEHEYADAPFRDEILGLIGQSAQTEAGSIAELNMATIEAIARYLGWGGQFLMSSATPSGSRSDVRIAELVSCAGGSIYISGAGGQNYQSEQVYNASGIQLQVREYSAVPYQRGKKPFIPNLSSIDALMYLGPDALAAFTYPPLDAPSQAPRDEASDDQ